MTATTSRGLATMLVALCLATPAVAKDKKPIDPNKKVCRADSSDTGSIMPKKICHTVSEWAAIDHAAGTPGSKGDLRGGGAGRPAGF